MASRLGFLRDAIAGERPDDATGHNGVPGYIRREDSLGQGEEPAEWSGRED